jgi:hypothetical protein
MDDATIGKYFIIIVLTIFVYFTCWLFIPPFADFESFINQLFPSVYNALVLPVIFGVIFIISLIIYTYIAIKY